MTTCGGSFNQCLPIVEALIVHWVWVWLLVLSNAWHQQSSRKIAVSAELNCRQKFLYYLSARHNLYFLMWKVILWKFIIYDYKEIELRLAAKTGYNFEIFAPLTVNCWCSHKNNSSILHLTQLGLDSINLYIGAPRSITCCSQSDWTPNGFSPSHPPWLVFVSHSSCTRTSLPFPYSKNCCFILNMTSSMSDCRNTCRMGNISK